ncbi:MAG: acyltransferase [Prevotella sp.]|nr:acyltransferase [Prevotella sp.]
MMKKGRESNMELLRIISMLCIVIYHIFIFGLEPAAPDQHLYKALQIPCHIGVPCFVLISGYFGIHFSFKGLFRLMGMAYTYAILVELIGVLVFHNPTNMLADGFLVIGHNRHWFLTTYLWLYLLSPMINKYIKDINNLQRMYLVMVLMFINFYAGHIMQHEPSLVEGKNILNFMLLYILGNTLHTYQQKIDKIKAWNLLLLFMMIAVFTTFVGMTIPSYQLPFIGNIWYRFFGYDSIGMYINAILVFMFFSKLRFQSRIVNYVAGSVFSMYLLSVSFIWAFVRDTAVHLEGILTNPVVVVFVCVAVAVGFMAFCVMVDKCMTPVWNRYKMLGIRLDSKYKI